MGPEKLSGLSNAGLVLRCSWPFGADCAVDGGLHMNELRSVFACLDKVMRNELLEDAEERFELDASAPASASCAEEVERLELDLFGCGRWSMAELDELAAAEDSW